MDVHNNEAHGVVIQCLHGMISFSITERMQLPSLIARRVIPGAGHFLPREKPEAVSTAILEVLAASK
jgi:pimeloyl-ACP methyl ester carboxylesterase